MQSVRVSLSVGNGLKAGKKEEKEDRTMKKPWKWAVLGLITVFCMMTIAGCSSGAVQDKNSSGGENVQETASMAEVPEYVLTYAENQTEDYPTTKGAKKFAELVEKRTNGRIKIKVYANAELGDEISVIEQLQFGGIDFARVSVMSLAEFVPELNVLQLPYLYRDAEHKWAVLDGEIGDELLTSIDGSGVKGLSWYDAGVRHLYNSVRPINSLEDLEGLRIRVADSDMMERMMEELGAIPVSMAFSEVYSALQTGQIDGAENNWSSYGAMKHYQVAKYMTLTEHNQIPEVQLISEATWNQLSEEDQQIIRQCAEESAVYQRELWEKRIIREERRAEKYGCVVTELGEKEKERFREQLLPLYQEFCSDYMDVVERIVKLENEDLKDRATE